IARAFRDHQDATRACFVAGDVGAIRRGAGAIAKEGETGLPVAIIDNPRDALAAPPRCVPVLPVARLDALPRWGEVSGGAGRAAADTVVWAARAALRGEIAAMVTAPLHKEAFAAAGAPFPGHTELLQFEAAAFLGKDVSELPVCMMLAN